MAKKNNLYQKIHDKISNGGYSISEHDIIFTDENERVGELDGKGKVLVTYTLSALGYEIEEMDLFSHTHFDPALKFRSFLDKNKIPYQEKPSRKEVYDGLITISKNFKYLADKINSR